jgi:hypothetical protein
MTPQEAPKPLPIVEKYENKYKPKYDLLEMTPLTEEERVRLQTNVLYETTPIGNVVMFYDDAKKSFEYYSDKVIPFRFLETVSRKYVVTFHCKAVYVNEGNRKETNRYTYLGKIVNFTFCKKADKKLVNKKLNMSFREFKNMKL